MNDDEYGSLLLRPLAADPPGVSRIDVAKAMRDGRRRGRWRMWAAGVGTGAVVTAATAGGVFGLADQDQEALPMLPPDPVKPASCQVSTLPMGGEKSAEVRGGDPSGTYLVGAGDPFHGGRNSVMVWRDGKLVTHLQQTGGPALMSDVNRSGVAVGGTDGYPGSPYFLRGQKIEKLRGYGRAVTINDAGVIAGDHEKDGSIIPQRWASPDSEPELMTLPEGAAGGSARDIDQNGVVLAELDNGPHLWHPDGRVEPLTPPRTSRHQQQTFKVAGFNYGWVYGLVRVSSSTPPTAQVQEQLYRFDPGSKVWQLVSADQTPMAQLPGHGSGGAGWMSRQPKIFVGKEVLDLPTEPRNGDDGFAVTVIGAGARAVAGTNLSMSASDRPALPILWRCR